MGRLHFFRSCSLCVDSAEIVFSFYLRLKCSLANGYEYMYECVLMYGIMKQCYIKDHRQTHLSAKRFNNVLGKTFVKVTFRPFM